MRKLFALGIPTLNRYDLLKPSLMLYLRDFRAIQIYVIDNGKQGIEYRHHDIHIFEQEQNMGVAKSWNLLCDKIFENHDNALILNDDIYLGKHQYEIKDFLETTKSDFYVTTQDWSAFIIPKKTFERVGQFDEKFYPAYYEDNDYHYRMKLLGMNYNQTPILNPYLYNASMTTQKNPSLKDGIEKNKQYYRQKWGGFPSKEKFKKPFNQ